MKGFKPVEVSSNAFNFCKYTIAAMLWLSLIFQSKPIVIIAFVILLLSALLKVQKAPLVILFTYTLGRFLPGKKIILEENSLCFAHTVGTILSGIALIFLYYLNITAGWIIISLLAVLKTSGAFGLCGAAKLYECLNNPNGTCCRTGSKIKRMKSN